MRKYYRLPTSLLPAPLQKHTIFFLQKIIEKSTSLPILEKTVTFCAAEHSGSLIKYLLPISDTTIELVMNSFSRQRHVSQLQASEETHMAIEFANSEGRIECGNLV